MPTGLKQTSAPLVVSFGVGEAVANTFNQAEVDMQLNVLDREVMVVTGVDIDLLPPEAIAGTNNVSAVQFQPLQEPLSATLLITT